MNKRVKIFVSVMCAVMLLTLSPSLAGSDTRARVREHMRQRAEARAKGTTPKKNTPSYDSSSSSYSEEHKDIEIRCSRCSGSGRVSCSACNGSGGSYEYSSVPNYSGRSSTSARTWHSCSKCHGSGQTNCSDCSGRGYITRGLW